MVDASLRATILESLWRLKVDRGISIVYVTHDLTTAYQIADRIVVMFRGEIVEDGDPDAVIQTADASLHAGAGRCGAAARSQRRLGPGTSLMWTRRFHDPRRPLPRLGALAL